MSENERPISERWYKAYLVAKAYFEAHGDLNVPARYVDPATGMKLGSWVANQRYSRYPRREGQWTLSEKQIELLEGIGMEWGRPEGNRGAWEEYIARIKAYKDEHGDCMVPRRFVSEDGYPLGKLVSDLRSRSRTDDPWKQIPEEFKARLDALGFNWGRAMNEISEERWNEGFTALKRFLDEGGSQADITSKLGYDGYPLGQWFYAQICSYRGAPSYSPMPEERAEQLKGLGIDFALAKKRVFLCVHYCQVKDAVSPPVSQPVLVHIPAAFGDVWREACLTPEGAWATNGGIYDRSEVDAWAELLDVDPFEKNT